jgi:hypothetical protein
MISTLSSPTRAPATIRAAAAISASPSLPADGRKARRKEQDSKRHRINRAKDKQKDILYEQAIEVTIPQLDLRTDKQDLQARYDAEKLQGIEKVSLSPRDQLFD